MDLKEFSQKGSLVAKLFEEEFKANDRASILGKTITNEYDLAVISQVYRSPNMETFRYVFTKDDQVVGTTAISSRQVNASRVFIDNIDTFLTHLVQKANDTNADSFYFLHNHPSGDPTPSRPDYRTTETLISKLHQLDSQLSYKGHVIINSKKFAFIHPGNSTHQINDLNIESSYDLNSLRNKNTLLAVTIQDQNDLAVIAKKVQQADVFQVIGTDSKNQVNIIFDVGYDLFEKTQVSLQQSIIKVSQNYGCNKVFLANVDSSQIKDAPALANIFTDILDSTGSSYRALGKISPKPDLIYHLINESVEPYFVHDFEQNPPSIQEYLNPSWGKIDNAITTEIGENNKTLASLPGDGIIHEEEELYRSNHYDSKAALDDILDLMISSRAPWQKEWQAGTIPFNYSMTSNSAYHGFNQITLIMASLQKGYQDPRWLTFEQAKSYGAMIKPNEKAVRLSYYKKITEDTPTYDENGNISESQKKDAIKRIPFCIFNAEQVIGLPEYQHDTDSIKVSHRVDELIKNSGIQIVNSDRKSLSYNLKDDVLKIPHRQSFKGQTHYQETMIHGMAHWSGHASRLNRTMTAAFGTEEYALEKLRTDISAFLISGELGLGYTPRANSAYVDTWIQKLTNEPAYFHKITGDVKKIEGFIMKYDNETLKEQFKNYSVLNDPNIIPLKVPFEEKDEAKALGARYQRNAKCWFIQKTDNQDVFKKWLPKDHSKNVDKQNIEMSDRLYLYVPYSEREDAKTTGAKWDGKFKSWYCNKSEKKQFSKWVFEIEKPKAFNTQSFDDVLFKNGFTFLPGQTLQDDGNWHQLHRISNGKRNASYMTWDAKDNHKNIAGAVIKDFVSSEKTYWFEAEANSEKSIPKEQKHMRMVNALQRDQVQKNEAREHLKEMISSCTKEHHSLDNLFDSFPNHKYFHELKKIKPTKGIKYKKTHEIKKKDGSTFTLKNVATVPLFNIDNEITGFQRIDEKGNKYYDSNIIKKESFHPCGDYIKGQPICLAEGIATAISIHELSGLQVHSTLDCHNLEDVAKKLNEKYPERPILFFADDDHAAESENVGQVHAYNAAKKLKQPTHHVISPPLTQEDIKNGYTDFNDVHQSRAEEISVFINQNLKEHLDITLDIEEDINDENPSPTKPKKEHDSKKGYSPEPQRLAMSTSKDLDDDAGY